MDRAHAELVWRRAGPGAREGGVFDIGDDEVWIFPVASGFAAVSNVCSHRLGPVSQGSVRGGVAECPWHGYRFELSSGWCVSHRCPPLRRYAVAVKNGSFFVRETSS